MHSISTQSIHDNIDHLTRQIATAAVAAGRQPSEVRLIAVSKTHSAEAVRAAAAAGLSDFGENYLQEALPKIEATRSLTLTWHYVGAIQSNKTRDLARHFDWIHTVERLKVARRLSEHCPSGKILQLCLQVNVDNDPNKSGVATDELDTLFAATVALPNLQIRGLMTILDPTSEPMASYQRLQTLFSKLRQPVTGVWDTLSMGMSGDYAAAIAAGATYVRIGTAIFGPRRPRPG